jgi:hypothetical protein
MFTGFLLYSSFTMVSWASVRTNMSTYIILWTCVLNDYVYMCSLFPSMYNFTKMALYKYYIISAFWCFFTKQYVIDILSLEDSNMLYSGV